MTVNIHALMRSNYVIRYAPNPDLARYGDTNGHHQAMVAQIIFALHPNPSQDLIYEALHHDVGEMNLGDIAGPAKAENRTLADLLDFAEGVQREKVGAPRRQLNVVDAMWLRFADSLAAFHHVRHVAPHLLQGDDWVKMVGRLVKQSVHLGVPDALREA